MAVTMTSGERRGYTWVREELGRTCDLIVQLGEALGLTYQELVPGTASEKVALLIKHVTKGSADTSLRARRCGFASGPPALCPECGKHPASTACPASRFSILEVD